MMDRDLAQCNISAFHEANFIFAPATPRALPVLIVTGFLGSGKTTLLRQLLSKRGNLKVAALAHDLASSLNVDAPFLASIASQGEKLQVRQSQAASTDGDVAALSGCSCCPGFEDALSQAVRTSLTQGTDTGRLDYLVLETSGAADPRRLITSLDVRFGPLARVRLDRVVTVLDAERFSSKEWSNIILKGTGSYSDEDRLQLVQLSVADVVLLNKIDLVSPDSLEAALKKLQILCPQAKLLTSIYGEIPLPELMDVVSVPSTDVGTVSHEQAPACWEVKLDLEDRVRRSTGSEQDGMFSSGTALAAAIATGPLVSPISHQIVLEWSTRDAPSHPVFLARLQEFFCRLLPKWRKFLLRGKGFVWVAEDPDSCWEWELSGRLRYACRRDAEGYRGSQPWSGLVLIFSSTFPSSEVVRQHLAELIVPVTATAHEYEEVVASLQEGSVSFELLGQFADQQSNAHLESNLVPSVVRFRLTGRLQFGISDDVDLSESPYRVDLDSMNLELARLVNMSQGGLFLAVGTGICVQTKRPVTALLLPVPSSASASLPSTDPTVSIDEPPPTGSLEAVLCAARMEAPALLRKYFRHVQSCQCGQ